MIFLKFILLLISFLMLWKGADWLVEASAKIAKTFGISEIVIGLTVVAFGTSAPEFAVSIDAAIKAKSAISLGNIVGSNIFNLGFILGSVAIVKSITTTKTLVYRDAGFLIIISALLFFCVRDLSLSRIEGIIFISLLICYIIYLFFSKKEKVENTGKLEKAGFKDYFLLILGLICVVGGGELLVNSAVFISRRFGISEWVISVTIVAAGTSAPEMVTSLVAALKNRPGLSIGNLIGSDIYNLLGVLGTSSIITPLKVEPVASSSVIMLFSMVVLTFILMRIKWKLSRIDGIILVLFGIFRWCLDFLV